MEYRSVRYITVITCVYNTRGRVSVKIENSESILLHMSYERWGLKKKKCHFF